MFEKMAMSLNNLPTEIHIGGQPSQSPFDGNVKFHPFTSGSRLSILLQARKLILDLKPRLVVACSPDLFLLAAKLQSKSGFKLVYDIQENYFLNYKYLYGSNWWKRKLANLIFGQSLHAAKTHADAIVLAEDAYRSQLQLSDTLVLENKMSEAGLAFAQSHISWPTERLELVFTGTLSASHGLFEAISFAESIYAFGPARLKIIGFMNNLKERNELRQFIQNKSFVETIGIEEQVPHDILLKHIAQAHAGLVFYEENKAFKGKAPTKVFEYLSLSKRALVLNAQQFLLPKSNLIIPIGSRKETSKELYNELLGQPQPESKHDLLFGSGKFKELVKTLIF